jgi:isopentenyl-diphosphate delta-isomerase
MERTIPAWVGGRLTPVDKLEVHRRGLPHPAVSVFVFRGALTLLQRRAAGKYHSAGLWANACCTHPRWGEPAAACAARRLREELGIAGLDLRWRARVDYRAEVGGGLSENERVEVFTADAPAGVAIVPDPAEVAEVRWEALPSCERRWRGGPKTSRRGCASTSIAARSCSGELRARPRATARRARSAARPGRLGVRRGARGAARDVTADGLPRGRGADLLRQRRGSAAGRARHGTGFPADHARMQSSLERAA